MRKVELLAPAGNFEALTGAVRSGADAVYLGGSRFGARAYAENFSDEEIIQGIRFAHLYSRKVYLTVNTLVKEKEFSQLYEFLAPLYEAGLDGVIVQDIGVLRYIRGQFPDLPIHASTQMNITDALGAAFLKEEGVSRIVPARELSLAELAVMKEKVAVELETFVHGAMCYCYSGRCLFSSILGGRSGNRGRCAQPCRLPYQNARHEEWYPLSMKDLCTVEILPQLIEAGIDSFKIEGRMKKAEYAAGVTAIYRKYIDRYYEWDHHASQWDISPQDIHYLQSLYIRSEVSRGYYHQHNGLEMLTPVKPGYLGSDEALLLKIRQDYIEGGDGLPITGTGEFILHQPARLTVTGSSTVVTVTGDIVEPAQNKPLTEEVIEKQLRKTGNTEFTFADIEIRLQPGGFLTVKSLNDLRRTAILALADKLAAPYLREHRDELLAGGEADMRSKGGIESRGLATAFHILVTTKEQLSAALASAAARVYMDIDMVLERHPGKPSGQEWFLTLPHIIRHRDYSILKEYEKAVKDDSFSGILIHNAESHQWLKSIDYNGQTVTDSGLYVWNSQALSFWQDKTNECYLPLECNEHEWKNLLTGQSKVSCQIYGYLPMMISANCLKKTEGSCRSGSSPTKLPDRFGKNFYSFNNCKHCYNIIYNTVPLSLHNAVIKNKLAGMHAVRVDLTIENGKQAGDVINYFELLFGGSAQNAEPPFTDYTTGHFKRGAE